MTAAKPFIKWAGGKRQLLGVIQEKLPKTMGGTYYEPFVGGGAVFFALANRKAFKKAVLSDMNSELVDTYKALSMGLVEEVIQYLKTYRYEREFFNELRARLPSDIIGLSERAARFIFLNKTGFNGLYRVNQKGIFNVPFGKYTNPTFCDEGGLREAARVLQSVEVVCQDYKSTVAFAARNDVVYFDPPYLPKSDTAKFVSYTSAGFGMAEHIELADTFKKLASNGVRVLLSNADLPSVRELFEGFTISGIEAKRCINSAGSKRGNVGEVLVEANLYEIPF